MTFGQSILNTFRDIRLGWARRADAAFSDFAPSARDDMARGEFISAFISESGLNFPRAVEAPQRDRN